MTRRRAFAIVVTYTLLALAIASFLTVQWTWTAIAYITLAASVAFVVVFAVTWVRIGRDLDNAVEELSTGIDVDTTVCGLERCNEPSDVVYDRHPSGSVLYICRTHAAEVRRWVG